MQGYPKILRPLHRRMAAFFLSGICVISSGIIVNFLHDQYQFNFSFSGTIVSIMCIGNDYGNMIVNDTDDR